ncbi:MAG: RNA 2',3'-cyclic phosphodiesterase [Candidatus Omnitrophica bacterium]|nr:RNA 2',3'-cyclic phosphodiesterase [Candidatus Omnitrophota bacterium]
MRTFIAIELPKDIKDSLSRLINKLKETGADVKWVAPQNIHLTLKFLGERDDKKVKEISEILDEVARNHLAFQIQINALGAFPNLNSSRVIWVGIDQGDIETKNIFKDLEDLICKVGIPKEDRAFSSHITIGRTRSAKRLAELSQVITSLNESIGRENLNFTAGSITLFKSTLTPKGPIYEALKVVNLTTI